MAEAVMGIGCPGSLFKLTAGDYCWLSQPILSGQRQLSRKKFTKQPLPPGKQRQNVIES